jgi:malate dehydrogenase
VPVKLGKNGIEEVIELNLNQKEYNLLHESANQVRALVKVFDNMNVAGSDDRG